MKKNIAIAALLAIVFFYYCREKKKTTNVIPIAHRDTFNFPKDTFSLPNGDSMGSVHRDVFFIPENEIPTTAKWKGKPVPPPTTQPPPTPTEPAFQPGVIYLNFTGRTVSSTQWNWNGDIIAMPAGLTVIQIQYILDRFYATLKPYADSGLIKITTDKNVFDAAPVNKHIELIFSTTSAWFGSSGGVSYVGSFNWGTGQPAWVFTALLNYNEKYIFDSGIHEFGHTVGLYHDITTDSLCTYINDYNRGNCIQPLCINTPRIGCDTAPIMGIGYYKPYSRFCKDGLTGNGKQDELLIISKALHYK